MKNNKGFSLVELLVSIAVGGIVLIVIGSFISSGTGFFNKQSDSLDIQNELQVASNRITDSLMEATSLIVKNEGEAGNRILTIYTGDFSDKESKIKPKCIIWNEKDGSLFVADEKIDAGIIDEYYMGYCVSKCVTNMTITINDDCLDKIKDENGLDVNVCKQPVTVQVNLTVTGSKDSKSDMKTTTLRNRLKVLEYNGKSYVLQ